VTARAALAAALLLAACGRVQDSPGGVRLLSSGGAAHGHAVSADGRRAAWVRGDWPDRTALVLLDLSSGRRRERRLKGYSLAEAAFAPDGGLKVLARKTGVSDSPHNPPKRAAILDIGPDGELLSAAEDPGGRVMDRRLVPWHQGVEPAGQYPVEGQPELLVRGPRGTVWIASALPGAPRWTVQCFEEASGKPLEKAELPGPAESLLPTGDALYALTRSSESLSGAPRGPRLLTKVDLRTGREAWSAPWAPRRSALLARGEDGRLYAAVRDPQAPSLWSFEDGPRSAAAAGAAAAAPGAARARTLRTTGMYLVRFLPAIVLGALFVLFRR
jgi:hypothetical protein